VLVSQPSVNWTVKFGYSIKLMLTGQLHAFSIHLHFDPSEHNGSWLIVMLLLLSLSCSDKQSRIGVCPSQDTYNEHSLLSRMHEYLNCTSLAVRERTFFVAQGHPHADRPNWKEWEQLGRRDWQLRLLNKETPDWRDWEKLGRRDWQLRLLNKETPDWRDWEKLDRRDCQLRLLNDTS